MDMTFWPCACAYRPKKSTRQLIPSMSCTTSMHCDATTCSAQTRRSLGKLDRLDVREQRLLNEWELWKHDRPLTTST